MASAYYDWSFIWLVISAEAYFATIDVLLKLILHTISHDFILIIENGIIAYMKHN